MATATLTFEDVERIAVETIREYRLRCMEAQHERCGDWLKVQSDWQGWDDGVVVMTPEDFRARYEYEAGPEDMPADCVATIHSGFAGAPYAEFIGAGADSAAVVDAVLGCLPSED